MRLQLKLLKSSLNFVRLLLIYFLVVLVFCKQSKYFLNGFSIFFAAKHPLNISAKSEELDDLFHDVRATLEAKSISVDQIVSYLISLFPNLENELECCKSLQDVFNVIRTYTSLVNVSYLETITDKYELSQFDDILQQYHTSIEEMCEEILVNELYEQTFMHHFTRHLLKEESMTLVIKLKEDEKYTLLQIMHLLNSCFNKMTSSIKLIKLTGNNDSVDVLCYVPFHLFNMLVRTVTDNTAGLIQANILAISIGGFRIFQRDLKIEKEVSVVQYYMYTYRNIINLTG